MTQRRNLLKLGGAWFPALGGVLGASGDAAATPMAPAENIAEQRRGNRRDWASVRDFGARGDGRTDDTSAIQAALDSGASHVLMPGGRYAITGVQIKEESALRELMTVGFPSLELIAARNRIALEIRKQQFVVIGDLQYSSMGSKSDNLGTIGLSINGRSYLKFGHQRFEKFSYAGARAINCVYVDFSEVTASSCNYACSFEHGASGEPCVQISVGRAYISGCRRGVYSNGTVNLRFGDLILEYNGSAEAHDGALHLVRTRAAVEMAYFEANSRNRVLKDAVAHLGAEYVLSAAAPDIVEYESVPWNERGFVQSGYSGINTPRLGPDHLAGLDLRIGENMVVPVNGGSVQWGPYTVERLVGRAHAPTWTTIKELAGQSGDGAARLSYRYEVYAGRGDRTTGYDKGAILNATIYSESGKVPEWLRIHQGRLQVKMLSSGYGLDWGVTLMTAGPIGA